MAIQNLIPMARVVLGEEEIEGVVRVLRSGALRQGQVCADFEEAFARKVGARHAVVCSSGTAALHLAYWAVLEPGDEVLVPAFTFAATATAAMVVGARPVFVDVDPDTLLMDPEDAAAKITPRSRALAPVHLYGNACPADELLALAREHNLRVVWDAAQAHGTRYRGKDVGALPDLVCYSFYPTKNMTTGEGGMITTDDPELDRRLRLLRSHGMEGKYHHVVLGLNYRMTDMAAALGLAQLQRLGAAVERRRTNAAFLTRRLRGLPGVQLLKVRPETGHSYHQFTVLLRDEEERDAFRAVMAEQGVETAVHYPSALHQQPIFRDTHGRERLPVAESAAARVCSLPVHPELEPVDLERIARAAQVATEGGGWA
jgi:perosamine synthetase